MSSHDILRKLRALRQTERSIRPDSAWEEKTRETLLMQVSNSMPVVRPAFTEHVREAVRHFVPSRFIAWLRGPAMSIISIFGVVLGSSVASVSAAEHSIPGDFLYPVKLATEQTRLAFTSDRTDKLKLKTEFTGRRIQEIKTIVSTDVTKKQERLKEAAEILKRDLDTVKTQLHEVSTDGPVTQVAEAAKLIDQKSTEIAQELKTVKTDKTELSDETRVKMTEAEASAMTTGVKAVQVLIDSHDNPDAKDVVTDDELIHSIQGKVQGMEDNIADAKQKLVDSGMATSTLATKTASSTTTSIDPATNAAASSSLSQLVSAQASLTQTKQLIQENKLDEAKDTLGDAVKAVASADASVNTTIATNPIKDDLIASTTTLQITPVATTSAGVTIPTLATSTPSGVDIQKTTSSSILGTEMPK